MFPRRCVLFSLPCSYIKGVRKTGKKKKGCTCRERIKMELGEEEKGSGRWLNSGTDTEERSVLAPMSPVSASD